MENKTTMLKAKLNLGVLKLQDEICNMLYNYLANKTRNMVFLKNAMYNNNLIKCVYIEGHCVYADVENLDTLSTAKVGANSISLPFLMSIANQIENKSFACFNLIAEDDFSHNLYGLPRTDGFETKEDLCGYVVSFLYQQIKYSGSAEKFSDVQHLVRCDNDQLMYCINGAVYKYKIIKYES